MMETSKTGKKYYVGRRQQTPDYTEPDNKCDKCGRNKAICGVGDCEKHFHNVEVRE